MRAAFDDPAVIQHHDRVRVPDRRKPVRDDEHGAALHQIVHSLLHKRLGPRIDGRGRLIQDHHRRIRHRRAGDGDQLPLALGKLRAVRRQHRLIPVGQPGDEVIGVGESGRLDALLVRGVQSAVPDVFHHGTGEEVHVLKHHAERAAEIRLADLVDVDAVVADLTVRDIVETVDQIGDRRLPRAGGADEGDLLARLRIERNVVEYLFFRRVSEIHMLKHHVAAQLHVGGRQIRFVEMLPRPHPGRPIRLDDLTGFISLRVDQRDISLVLLRLLIDEVKDASRARKSHRDHRNLHRHLTDGLGQLARHAQKRDDDAGRHRTETAEADITCT